jgi:hypothetical protein
MGAGGRFPEAEGLGSLRRLRHVLSVAKRYT